MPELPPYTVAICAGMLVPGYLALSGIIKQLKKNQQLKNSLHDVRSKTSRLEQELKPQYIRVLEQGDGVKFDIIGDIPWVSDGQFEREYKARTVIRTDVARQLKKCKYAWNNETGLFFEYPDFATGLPRTVRIIGAHDVSKVDEDGQQLPLLELTVVLTQADVDDMKRKKRS